ncbi:protein FAM166B-like isoform X2 [Stegodyphus dumicola]|nr:protein FAM166B-like isoform X2 [Stegodyphus dumicola]
MTHHIMSRHPVAGGRLGNILCSSDDRKRNFDYDMYVRSHEKSPQCVTLRNDMVTGYTGHVPRKDFYCGKNYQERCRRGNAEFERMKRENSCRDICSKYVPPADILPRTIVFQKRLHERPHHRNIPSYATFTNPMNYGLSVYEMSDLDPRKTYMPGYTGYYTGKCFDTGVTHSAGAHQDLCDLTSSRLERLVAERRPKISDWYKCPVVYASEPVTLDGYHLQLYRPAKPVPGYAGHVPGFRDSCHGQTFGNCAGPILRERELMFCEGLRHP